MPGGPLDAAALQVLAEEEVRALLESILKREDALRLHPKVQAAYTLLGETETALSSLTAAVQARVGREHGLAPPSLASQLLRSATTLVPDLAISISHYVKYNRASAGTLQPGDAAPDVTLATLDGAPASLLASLPATGPTLLLAASYT